MEQMILAFYEARQDSEIPPLLLLSAIVPISKQDIAEKVPDISINTIELVLSKMLKEKKIEKIGTYKDARYVTRHI